MKRDEYSFFERYIVHSSLYDILKFQGKSVRDEERGINLMMEYFSEHLTEELLRENMERYSLNNMFDLVRKYFQKEYHFTGEDIELSNSYQRSISSYIYKGKETPPIIHIDELFESTVMAFFLVVFKWSKDFHDIDVYGNCFCYLLYLMNDVCLLGEIQGENANRTMMQMIKEDVQILQLAEDCYRTVLIFNIAHEFAHAYLRSIGKKYTKQHPEKEEFDADEIAYHIVLKIIMDGENKDGVLENYTYLAPMMYVDFAELMYYTDRVLYKNYLVDNDHPTLKKRKQRLFAIVDRDEYDFDTEMGNHLYSGFLDVWDEYKDQVLLKMERGKLDNILRTEQRKAMRSKYHDEKTSD